MSFLPLPSFFPHFPSPKVSPLALGVPQAFPLPLSFPATVVLPVGSLGQQCQHHLGTWYKFTFSGPAPEELSQKHRSGAQQRGC